MPLPALACAGAPAPLPASGEAPAAKPIASAPAAAAPVALASAVPSPSASSVCPSGQLLGSDGNCKAPAPCIDGEEMMGACICPHGKSVDDTGHCVAARCPEGTTGGIVFRNEATGDCMECHPGTVPCGDHCCPGAKRSR